ncbi:MAG: tRNA (cytidine(34)-2'-O)-methyltransferase [Alphaproteobacteria bacterium]|jgi:tRNA (cytidine/uridine-2'-O-)-methyltransferase|nr:tRNA methyltransferase [Alphaproteobacteria bacterium]
MLRLAFYQPEIPQNTGTLLRLAACMGISLDLIEPCGFVLTDARMRRAGMDYLELASLNRHENWQAFHGEAMQAKRRLVLLCPRAPHSLTTFTFTSSDTLLLGTESSGVPEDVRAACPASVHIPMLAGRRSLNVAISAAMVLTEAMRQLEAFPASSFLEMQ